MKLNDEIIWCRMNYRIFTLKCIFSASLVLVTTWGKLIKRDKNYVFSVVISRAHLLEFLSSLAVCEASRNFCSFVAELSQTSERLKKSQFVKIITKTSELHIKTQSPSGIVLAIHTIESRSDLYFVKINEKNTKNREFFIS